MPSILQTIILSRIATIITILLLCESFNNVIRKIDAVPVTLQCTAPDEVKTVDDRNTPGFTYIIGGTPYPRCTYIFSNSVISNVEVSLSSVVLDDTSIIMRNVTCTMPSGTKACLHFLGDMGSVLLQGPKLVSLENVTVTFPSTNTGGDLSMVRFEPLRTIYKLDTFVINNCSLNINGTYKSGGKQEVDIARIYGTMLNVVNFTVSNSNFYFGWSGSAGNFEATVVSLRGQVDCPSMQLTLANISVIFSAENSTMGCNVAGLAFKNTASVNNNIKTILVSNMSITILHAVSKTGGNGIYFHGWFWSKAAVDTTQVQVIDNSLIIPHSAISGNTPNVIDIKGFRMEKSLSTESTRIFELLQVSRNSIVFVNSFIPTMAAANLYVTLIHFDQDLRDINFVEFENNIVTPFQFNSGANPNNLAEILHVEGVTKNLINFSLSGCEIRFAIFPYFNASHFGPIFFGSGVRDIVNSFKISNIYFKHDPAGVGSYFDSIYSGIWFGGPVYNISYSSNNTKTTNYGGLLISNVTLAVGSNTYACGTYSFKMIGVKFFGTVSFVNNINISSFTIDKSIRVTAVTFMTNMIQFDSPVATINAIAIKNSSMGTAGYQTITMFGQGFSSSFVNASTGGSSGFDSVRSIEISNCQMSHTAFEATPSLTPNVEIVFFEVQIFNSIGRLVMTNNAMTINSKLAGHNYLSFKYLDFISQPMINKEGIILDGLQMNVASMTALQGITFVILHARNAIFLSPQLYYGGDGFDHALIMQNFNIKVMDVNCTAAAVPSTSYFLLTGTPEMTAMVSSGFQARSLIINNITRFFRTNDVFDAVHRLVYIPQDYTFSPVISITNITDTFDKCAASNGVFFAYHVQLQSIRQVETILISNYTTDVTNGLSAKTGFKFFVLGIFGVVQDNAFVMKPSASSNYSSFEVSNSRLHSSDRSLNINSTATNLRNISIVRLSYPFAERTTGLRNISSFIIRNNSIEHVRFDPSTEPRTGMFFQIFFVDGSLSIEYNVHKIIITDNVIRNVSVVASKKCGAMIAAIHGGFRNPDSVLDVDGDRKVIGFTAPPTIDFSGNRIVNVGPVFCAHGLFLPAALNSTDFCLYAAANVTGPGSILVIPSSFSTFGSPYFRISNNQMENISIPTRLIDNVVAPTDNEASFSLFDVSRCLIESYPSTVEITRNALQNIGFNQNSMSALNYELINFSWKTFLFGAFFVRFGSIVACGDSGSISSPGKSVAFAGGVRCSSDGNKVVGIPNSENFGAVIEISHNIFSPFVTYSTDSSNNNNNNGLDAVNSDINNNFENLRLAVSTPNRTTFLYIHKDANISGNVKIEHNIVPTVNDSDTQVNLFAYGSGSALSSMMYLENSCFIRGNTTLTISANYQFPFTFKKTLQTVPSPLQIIFLRTNTAEFPAIMLSNGKDAINKASFEFACNHWSRLYEKPFANVSFLDQANMVNFTGCTQTKSRTRTLTPHSTTTTTTTTTSSTSSSTTALTVGTFGSTTTSTPTLPAVSSTTPSVIFINITSPPTSTTTPPPLTATPPMQSSSTSTTTTMGTTTSGTSYTTSTISAAPIATTTTTTTSSITTTTTKATAGPTAKQRTLTLSPRLPVIYTKPLVASVPATIVAAGNVASVFTGSSVVATLGVRNGLLQAQMSCANPPAPLDIGTHLTQIEVGSDQYRWWRGVLVGNSALVLASLVLLGIVLVVQKITKSSLVDRFLNKCVIAAGTLWLVLSGSSGIGFVALVAYAGGNSNETDLNAYSSAKNYVIAFLCGGFLLLPPLIITVIVCRYVNNNFTLEAYVVANEIEAAMKQLEKGRNEPTTTGATAAVDLLEVELLPPVTSEQQVAISPSSENNVHDNNNNVNEDTCGKKFFRGFLIVTEYCFAPFKGFGWPEHNRFVKRYGFLFERSSWLTFPIAELLISYFINVMIGLTQSFDVSIDFCRISAIITLVVQFLPLIFVLIVRNLLTRIDVVVTVLMSVLNLVTSLLVVLKFYDVTAVADELDNPYMKTVSMLQGAVNLLATIAFLSYFVRSSIWLAARKARSNAAARRNNNNNNNGTDGNGEGDDDFIMSFIAGGRNNQTLAWADNLMRDEDVMNIIADVLVQPRSRNNEQDHILLNDEEIEIDLDLDDVENRNNNVRLSSESGNAELDELDRLMTNQNDDDDDDEFSFLQNHDDLNAAGDAKYKRNQELEERRLEMKKILTQKSGVDI